ADVQRLYRPKIAPLQRGNRANKTNFWQNSRFGLSQNQNTTAEQRAELRALQKEQKELVQSLLGKDVYAEMARDSGYLDWTHMMFGAGISQEKHDLVTEMQQRFSEARQEIYAKADGYFDQDTTEEIKTLERKFHDELAKALTPDQLFEYEARSSDLA